MSVIKVDVLRLNNLDRIFCGRISNIIGPNYFLHSYVETPKEMQQRWIDLFCHHTINKEYGPEGGAKTIANRANLSPERLDEWFTLMEKEAAIREKGRATIESLKNETMIPKRNAHVYVRQERYEQFKTSLENVERELRELTPQYVELMNKTKGDSSQIAGAVGMSRLNRGAKFFSEETDKMFSYVSAIEKNNVVLDIAVTQAEIARLGVVPSSIPQANSANPSPAGEARSFARAHTKNGVAFTGAVYLRAEDSLKHKLGEIIHVDAMSGNPEIVPLFQKERELAAELLRKSKAVADTAFNKVYKGELNSAGEVTFVGTYHESYLPAVEAAGKAGSEYRAANSGDLASVQARLEALYVEFEKTFFETPKGKRFLDFIQTIEQETKGTTDNAATVMRKIADSGKHAEFLQEFPEMAQTFLPKGWAAAALPVATEVIAPKAQPPVTAEPVVAAPAVKPAEAPIAPKPPAAEVPPVKPAGIPAVEPTIPRLPAAADHTLPKLENSARENAHNAKGFVARLKSMHWTAQTAIGVGVAALVGGAGYWVLKGRNNPEQQKTDGVRR